MGNAGVGSVCDGSDSDASLYDASDSEEACSDGLCDGSDSDAGLCDASDSDAGAKLSDAPGPLHRDFAHFNQVKEVVPGFFNIRAPFHVMGGALNVGTHMSIARLDSGDFVAIDAVKMNPELKREIDELTEGGKRLVMVLNTHPYHSVGIDSFHAEYPATETRKWIGCPRHLRTKPEIQWSGNLENEDARKVLEPEIAMAIPDGAEFNNPLPEHSNHFSSVFVLHRASKTVHDDDTIMFVNSPPVLMRVAGFTDCSCHFHPSMLGPGLRPTQEAPFQFKAWLQKLLAEWDFENICTAHNGCCYGHAKEVLQEALENADESLKKLSVENAKTKPKTEAQTAAVEKWEKCGWKPDTEQIECG